MVCNPAAARAEYGIAPGRHFAGSFAGFPSVLFSRIRTIFFQYLRVGSPRSLACEAGSGGDVASDDVLDALPTSIGGPATLRMRIGGLLVAMLMRGLLSVSVLPTSWTWTGGVPSGSESGSFPLRGLLPSPCQGPGAGRGSLWREIWTRRSLRPGQHQGRRTSEGRT